MPLLQNIWNNKRVLRSFISYFSPENPYTAGNVLLVYSNFLNMPSLIQHYLLSIARIQHFFWVRL